MKKLIALLVALTICLSCFSMFASAEFNEDFKICIDFIQTRENQCVDASTIFDQPVESLNPMIAENGETYELSDSSAKYLFFEGWYSTDYEYVDEDAGIGSRVDGGDIVWSSEPDPSLNSSNTYHDHAIRAFVNLLIYKGTHHVEVFAKVEEETDPLLLFEFDYEADFGEEAAPEVDPKALHGASFDTIYVNDVMNFGEADGSASDKLDARDRTVDGSDGSVQTVRVRGWIGFESAIDQFGYKINNDVPVYGDFAIAPEAAVVDPANGGQYASRFDITIPVAELKGTNTIVAVVKLADGTVVKIDEKVKANGAGTGPNTQFTFIGEPIPATQLHGASFDTLYINDEMNFGEGDGSASAKLDGHDRTVDGSDGSVEKIRVRGWIGFESALAQFGYKINDNEPVFGDFAIAPEAAVVDPANGGEFASRFDITIPVAELKGTNTIVAVVKLADGTIVEINENVTANGAGTAPNTQLTYVGPAAPETQPVTEAPVTEAPQTGDASVMAIAMIAVIALAAVLVIRKKVTE